MIEGKAVTKPQFDAVFSGGAAASEICIRTAGLVQLFSVVRCRRCLTRAYSFRESLQTQKPPVSDTETGVFVAPNGSLVQFHTAITIQIHPGLMPGAF